MTTVAEAPEQTAEKPKSEVLDTLKTVAVFIAAFLIIRVLIFQPFTIPSASMEPGLRAGDYIVVSKWDYGISRYSIPFGPPLFKGRIFAHAPKRGDVVVFKLPSDPKVDYIKRLIGLPGDRVQVREGVLYINDKAVPQKDLGLTHNTTPFSLAVEAKQETLPNGRSYVTFDQGYQMGDDTQVFVVPQGYYFFMGDNRDDSLDSRWPKERGVGFVPAENLVGKARFIMLSWKPGASLLKPWTWLKLEPSRFFKAIR